MPCVSSVLRLGPAGPPRNECVELLRAALVARFGGASGDGESRCALNVSNRYFNARVVIAPVGEGSDDVGDDDGHCYQEDGIVLAFDNSPPNSAAPPSATSFDSLAPVHAAAERLSRAGETLRLVVGVSSGPDSALSDGSKAGEREYSRRVLWCLDRGYEYVEADLSEAGRNSGHDARDKEGFARVVEAIETCMWSSHVMKVGGGGVRGGGATRVAAPTDGPRRPEEANGTAAEKVEGVDPPSRSSFAAEGPLPSPPRPERSEGDGASDDDDARTTAAVSTLMRGIDENSINGTAEYRSDETDSNQRRGGEMAFGEMDRLVTEAKMIREASRDGSATDDERRKRAGDAAVRLMGLMESFGLDDDSDDEDNAEEGGLGA